MDMKKIGMFIASLRKENGYTPEQVGEKLGVSGKTVSRWETGTYLPSVEMLQQLSDLYSVSINDILNGERMRSEDYPRKADENLVSAIENDRKLSARRNLAMLAGITAMLAVMFTALYVMIDFADMNKDAFKTTSLAFILVLAEISLLTIWIAMLRNNKMYLTIFILSVVFSAVYLTWILMRKYYYGFAVMPTMLIAMFTSYKAYKNGYQKKH